VPGGYYFQWIFDICQQIVIFVEKDVAEPASDDHSYCQIENEILGRRAEQSDLLRPFLFLKQKIAAYKAQDVHDPVPPHIDWADGEQDRVYLGIGNHFVASFEERLSYTAAGVNWGWALRLGVDGAGK
jgi:hypothetical protein